MKAKYKPWKSKFYRTIWSFLKYRVWRPFHFWTIENPTWQYKRRLVFNRDNGACHYCKVDLDVNKFTVDHYIPRAKGGTDRIENLRACCHYCNKVKRALMPSEDLFVTLRQLRVMRETPKQYVY